jgi:hypothetical protein
MTRLRPRNRVLTSQAPDLRQEPQTQNLGLRYDCDPSKGAAQSFPPLENSAEWPVEEPKSLKGKTLRYPLSFAPSQE